MMKSIRSVVVRFARLAGYVVGAGVVAAWLVSLAARASIGADMPQVPKSMLTGGLPATPAPMPPLVLPVRDPFAADNLRAIADRAAAAKKRRSLAAIQVPDPTSFGSVGSSGRGVLAVIVGDGSDSYALLEDGASIVIGHVGDAFGGSRIAAITETGVRLANNLVLAVDDQRKSASPSVVGGALPMPGAPQGQSVGPTDGNRPALQPGGQRSAATFGGRVLNANGTVSMPTAAVQQQLGAPTLPASARPATVTLPSSAVQGVQVQPGAIPGTNSFGSPSGSLFPLLSTPAPNR
jgi:hypothetical protein